MKCHFNYFKEKSRKGNIIKECPNEAVCIVRYNGKEYLACKVHKSVGRFVRPL